MTTLPSPVPAYLTLIAAASLLTKSAKGQSTGSCGFCPGGTPPLNPSALIDVKNDNTTTCGDTHNELITGLSAGEDCIEAQFDDILGLEDGYPNQCGYCAVPSEYVDTTCVLCPTGSVPSLPTDTPLTLLDGTSSTCGEVNYLTQYERIYSDECLALQAVAPYCGCEPTTCDICPDGSVMPDPSKWSFAAEMQCGDVVRNAADLDPTGEECRTVQTIVMGECGCEYVPPYDPGCNICADGSVVKDPSFQLFPGDELSTCGLYSWYAALPPFGTGDEQCTAMQGTFGAACGCADSPDPPCKVNCLMEGEVFNATHVVSDFEIGDADYLFDDYHMCGEILFEMSIRDEICTFDSIMDLADECCMVPPEEEEEEEEEEIIILSDSSGAAVVTVAYEGAMSMAAVFVLTMVYV